MAPWALALLALLGSSAVASPVWMPQFLTGGSGRNIRHLPCMSRRTGEQGVCMFALSCSRANGTHLGTCIDRFYFGSCCKIEGSPNNEENTLAAFPPSVTLATSAPPLDTPLSTFQTVNGNGIDETLSTPSYPSFPTRVPAPPFSTLGSTVSNEHTSTSQQPSSPTFPSRPPYVPTKPVTSKPVTTPTRPHRPPVTTPTKPVPSKPVTPKPGTQKPGVTTPQRPHNTTRPHVPTKPPTPKPTVSTRPTTPTQRPTATPKPGTAKPTATDEQKPGTTKPPSVRPPTPKPTTVPLKPTQSTPQRPPVPATPRPPTPTPQRPATLGTTKPTSKPTYPTAKPTTSVTKPRPKPPINATTARPTITTKRPPITTQKPYFTSAKPGAITTKKPTTTKRPAVHTTTQSTQYVLVSSTNSTSTIPEKYPSTGSTGTSSTPTSAATTTAAGLVTWTVLEPGGDTASTEKVPSNEEGTTTPAPASTATSTATATGSTATGSTATATATTAPASPSTPEVSSTWQQLPGITVVTEPTVATSAPSTAGSLKPPSSPSDGSTDATSPPAITGAASSPQNGSAASSPNVSSSTTETPGYGEIPLEQAEAFLNMSDFKQVCGRRFFPESRVVGGEKATFGKWPWQISLRQWRTNTYLHKCGAALLNENWAVTAAHCVENVPPADLLLRLGEHDLSSDDEAFGHEERRVQIVASHPQFDARTFEFDLALLRFNRPVAFRPNIVPVCVPEDDRSFVGDTAHVTGWGRLYEDGPLPSVLQEVSVPVLNNSACEAMYRQAGYVEHIPHIFICAGWRKGGFDSCEGDSGGPMVIQRDDRRWLLAGVISWGIGCAEPNQPGVYTRVSQFRDWINQILQF